MIGTLWLGASLPLKNPLAYPPYPCWINLDVCRIAPKMLWIHYLVGVSHIVECRENQPMTAWKILIIIYKIPYSAMWGKWKCDRESVSGTTSPPKLNQFFRLVGPIITASFNVIGWLLLQQSCSQTEQLIEDRQTTLNTSHPAWQRHIIVPTRFRPLIRTIRQPVWIINITISNCNLKLLTNAT